MYIQADADLHCMKHARQVYGRENVKKAIDMQSNHSEHTITVIPSLLHAHPLDHEGNLLHVIFDGRCPGCSECLYERVSRRNGGE